MSGEYLVRPLSEEDMPECIELWKASEGVGLRPEEDLAFFLKFLKRNPGLSHCALDSANGRLIACALAGHDGKRGHLYHVAVKREWRGKGIGGAICKKCLASLTAEGIERMAISVFADNEEALRFWQKNGWTLREDLKSLTIFRH